MAVYDEAKEFLAKLKDSTITISEIYMITTMPVRLLLFKIHYQI